MMIYLKLKTAIYLYIISLYKYRKVAQYSMLTTKGRYFTCREWVGGWYNPELHSTLLSLGSGPPMTIHWCVLFLQRPQPPQSCVSEQRLLGLCLWQGSSEAYVPAGQLLTCMSCGVTWAGFPQPQSCLHPAWVNSSSHPFSTSELHSWNSI